ncbi:hypothetical protein ASPZODRAFT_27057 [Penicilliopsis zonata CBS 506.65]|uniref:Uncharacterized protein n=1 Tax=Penicilliopsis zonata CBS 506.65 TaxID=1073090 RepID=A0A1L9SCY7_9EURO|nr:hypothetical protein ASPZODRAFT_27057 [Penicilliopsis zonata CBS 506.65]OJJ45029.1 hypothetical protein ASPZODRAFT_27057 [Penicilliopsis zonata CBS 506.65]
MLIFGDAVDKTALQQLYQLSQTRPQLEYFLHAVSDAISAHLHSVPIEERDSLRVSSLIQGQHGRVASCVYLTICQIGEFLIHAQDNPTVLNNEATGLHLGLLSACTASAQDTSQITRIGIEAVVTSLYVGIELARRSLIDEWGYCIIPKHQQPDIQRWLDGENAAHPPLRQVYIGVVGDEWTAVFGPVGRLGQMMQQASSPCYALHASHLTISAMQLYTSGIQECNDAAVAILQQPCRWGSVPPESIGIGEFTYPVDGLTRYPLPREEMDGIAIVGMAGRFPGCDGVDGLWDIPPSRFNISTVYDASEQQHNSTATRFGCFLAHPGLFDHRLFNISPHEAAQMDPLQRLFLTTTYEALEMAGYNPLSSDKSRVAVYFSQSTDDWRTVLEQQGIQSHYLQGTNRSFAPGRVSHFFAFGGGYYSIDTGCSSSATAVHLACAALKRRECEMAVVGGGNVCLIPEYFSGFSRGRFLSRTGACKTFSPEADGYCRGEAVGTVILKREEDAIRSNDHILAVIKGSARNTNAGEDASITYPGEQAQRELFKTLLGNREDPAISYVEMHGTGTQAGDQVEMKSVTGVLKPLHVGALKASIGHAEAAAGVSSLIKCCLIMKHGLIPAQPGLLQSSLDFIPNNLIPTETISLPPGDVVVNSFDAAGGNTSLLLGQPERIQREKKKKKGRKDPRSHQIVVLSGRTLRSLQMNRERLLVHLDKTDDVDLPDLAYTLTRRMHHIHQQRFVVESIEELKKGLAMGVPPPRKISNHAVFVFTGQGASYPGMGTTLYHTCPRFQRILDGYESLCNSQGFSFIESLQDANTQAETPTALVALEIGLATYLHSLGITPGLVMGHSLGEYAALCVAGVLSVVDTLYLVHCRALLLQEHARGNDYGMMSVSKDLLEEFDYKGAGAEVSCLNGSSTVISGPVEALEKVKIALQDTEHTVQCTLLSVPYAFHSSQMECILDEYRTIASRVQFKAPAIPIISTLTGDIQQVFDADYLIRQTRQPVNFTAAMQTVKRLIADEVVVEIGPHPTLVKMLASSLPNTTRKPTLQRGQSDWKVLSECLAALDVDWGVFHEDYLAGLSLLDLPTYAFDATHFWRVYNHASRPSSSASLVQLIQGHVVHGVAIAPASVLIEMAAPFAPPSRDLVDLQMKTPLLNGDNVTVDTTDGMVTVQSSSTVHATCQFDSVQKRSVPQGALSRMDGLSDASNKLPGHFFYKLFDRVVKYALPFRVLENIAVDGGDDRDALADVPARCDSVFVLDAMVHLPGFLLNCDLDDGLYIANRIERVSLHGSLDSPLRIYTVITDRTDDTATCSSYLFRRNEQVGVMTNIRFQRISKQTFMTITGLYTHDDYTDAEYTRIKHKTDYTTLLQTVARMTGISLEEVQTARAFADLGVDSHLGIAIIAEINKRTGSVLPAAFFNNFPTLQQAEQTLAAADLKHKSILLQASTVDGRKKTPLFLVSESSGSVAVYTHFPAMDRAIYGLESPFSSCPEKNRLSVPELARAYIAIMKHTQPVGPYLLGGYSFASLYAYEMVYQLRRQGEEVSALLIIDMYVPPDVSIANRFSLDGIGTGPLANITTRISKMFPTFTDTQKRHMVASMENAKTYAPMGMSSSNAPTHLIWASKGVNQNENGEEHDDSLTGYAWMGGDVSQETMTDKLKSWFFSPRNTFGTNGWEQLLTNIHIHTVDADHLSMVAPPLVNKLGDVIREALKDIP